MILDPAGIYLRRHGLGGAFIAGYTPLEENKEQEETAQTDLTAIQSNLDKVENVESKIDINRFERDFKPILSHRVPAFKDVEVKLYTYDDWFIFQN